MESVSTDPQPQVSSGGTLDSTVDSDFGSWMLVTRQQGRAYGCRPGLLVGHVTTDMALFYGS